MVILLKALNAMTYPMATDVGLVRRVWLEMAGGATVLSPVLDVKQTLVFPEFSVLILRTGSDVGGARLAIAAMEHIVSSPVLGVKHSLVSRGCSVRIPLMGSDVGVARSGMMVMGHIVKTRMRYDLIQ